MVSIDTEKNADEKRKVIFLDIDGVLQPATSQERFKHDLDALKEELAEKYNEEHFLKLDKYDVGAVYYDWNKNAVAFLHEILHQCNAEIVLSSEWRQTKTLTDMKCLMKIHNLDEHLTEMVPEIRECSMKYEDILVYLAEHPKLTKYVVIDDMNMEKYFRGRFVHCDRFLGIKEYNQLYRLLEYGPYWDNAYQKRYTASYLGETIEDKYKKVIFLDIDGVLNDDGEGVSNGEIIGEYYVRNLKEIVRKTDAEIVLSSSWRYALARDAFSGFSEADKSLSALYEAFDSYSLQIAGMTPRIYNGANGRPLEIRTWLAKRPEVSNFVILDDETFWHWGWLSPFVVTTSFSRTVEKNGHKRFKRECGLDNKYADQAIQILNHFTNEDD